MTGLSYDEVGEAFAIVLRDAPAVETIELADGVLLDVGEDGDPVGMEFDSLSQLAPFLIARGGQYDLPERRSTEPMGTRKSA